MGNEKGGRRKKEGERQKEKKEKGERQKEKKGEGRKTEGKRKDFPPGMTIAGSLSYSC